MIVSGLPANVDEKALDKAMRKYGPVAGITYPLGKDNTVIGTIFVVNCTIQLLT